MGYDTTAWTTAGNTLTIGGTTLYTNFFTHNFESVNFALGYHELLTYENCHFSAAGTNPNLGDGPDPATSFTLADSTAERASELVHCLWYLPDNIYIDGVYSIEGADADATDVTRMHLMSFDYTSASASVLTNGTLLAHDTDTGKTNAGTTKSYLSTWTVDSASVSSGKVIVVTFESDSINSDYSINVKVKYHLV